jgi:cytochrome P450
MASNPGNVEGANTGRPSLAKHLLTSDLSPTERAPRRVRQEIITMAGAGIDTVRWALSTACFHILDSPDVLKCLRAELVEAIPDGEDVPSLARLEQLPYLDACVQKCRETPSDFRVLQTRC